MKEDHKPTIKYIHTTIPYDIWMQAQVNNVSWAEALTTGIRIILGIEKKEEDYLHEQLNYHLGISETLKYQLEQLQKEKAKYQEQETKEYDQKILQEARAFRRIDPRRFM